LHIVSFPAASIPLTLQPAGLDKSVGLVTAAFLKEPGDPTWKDDPEVAEYVAFLKKYSPEANPNDWANVIAYYHAAAVAHLLAACDDELTRANLMHQATHIDHVHVPMLLPGITFDTSPTDTRRSSKCSGGASTARAGWVSAASSTASRLPPHRLLLVRRVEREVGPRAPAVGRRWSLNVALSCVFSTLPVAPWGVSSTKTTSGS
jgi:hypothetical protein